MPYQLGLPFAQHMDTTDPLAHFRSQFHIPVTPNGEEVVYLCGHSLGLQPRATRHYLEQVCDQWATLGIDGYFQGKQPWLTYIQALKPKLAKLVGAQESEVAIMNTVTVNLNLLMVSFYRPTPQRYKIVIEANAFPSDQYAVKSHLYYHGYDPATALIELQPREGENTLRTEDILARLEAEGDSIALVMLGGINYLSGQFFELAPITAKAHEHGCMVGFDLAHAVGNVPLALHDWQVDFAVWCSYKYLNSGAAAVGGCFVHERYADGGNLPRFSGWWGNDLKSRFLMRPDFEAATGADGWQMSNADVFSLAALQASLELFDAAGMDTLRAKSKLLTGYAEFLLRQIKTDRITLLTPSDPEQRGCQLSIQVKQADKSLFHQLYQHHIIGDWREPDVIRVAPVPLYNRFVDVFQLVEVFKTII